MRGALLLLIVLAAGGAAQSFDFAGTWVLRFQGRNLMVLTLKQDGGGCSGSIARPTAFTTDSDGYFEKISSTHQTTPLAKCVPVNGELAITLDENHYTFRITAKDRATLVAVFSDPAMVMAPWIFERSPHPKVVIHSEWTEPHFAADVVKAQQRLAEMVKEDQQYRQPGSLTFDPRAGRTDRKHRPELARIFLKYGWPSYSMMGKQSADQFWLLVQHQDLKLQLQVLPALYRAVNAGEASMSHYAFLYDNIQVAQGQLQRWGIKVKPTCENGKPVIFPVENPATLNQRRQEIGLMPIEAYLKMFEAGCGKQP